MTQQKSKFTALQLLDIYDARNAGLSPSEAASKLGCSVFDVNNVMAAFKKYLARDFISTKASQSMQEAIATLKGADVVPKVEEEIFEKTTTPSSSERAVYAGLEDAITTVVAYEVTTRCDQIVKVRDAEIHELRLALNTMQKECEERIAQAQKVYLEKEEKLEAILKEAKDQSLTSKIKSRLLG